MLPPSKNQTVIIIAVWLLVPASEIPFKSNLTKVVLTFRPVSKVEGVQKGRSKSLLPEQYKRKHRASALPWPLQQTECRITPTGNETA